MSEALLRIEHKLDLVISVLKDSKLMTVPDAHIPQLRDSAGDNCPVCLRKIQFFADIDKEEVIRKCGCSSPLKIVPGISKLTKEKSDASSRRPREDDVPPEQEESPGGSGGSPNLPGGDHR